MIYVSKKNFFYASLVSFLLLGTSSSYADCPDKTVPCSAVGEEGQQPILLGYQMVNYKSVQVKDAKSFFTALISGFKCYPCVDGCGDTITRAIMECNDKAKKAGYKAGYIDKNSLEGVSAGSVADSLLDRAEKVAKIGGDVAAAMKK